MKRTILSRVFLFLPAFTAAIILTGCAASMVRFDYKVPSIKEEDPHAVIIEENATKGLVTSKIKGFYVGPTASPENYVEPYIADSDLKAFAKTMYSITPHGMLAHAIHFNKGRMISVPSGRIGIVINHHYYRELSRKAIGSHVQGNTVYTTYMITYDENIWDSTMWVTLKTEKEYRLDLSASKLMGPEGIVQIEQAIVKEEHSLERQPLVKNVTLDKKGNIIPEENLNARDDKTP